METIKVDLSEAREGKLSEFFESEIEYIWLKDDVEDAQLGGLNKIFFHEDKIFTLDIFGCKCIKIFDKAGMFLSKIRAFGEGPEKYLDFDDAIIVNNEVLLLGVYPPKLMWFSLDGEFLREEKLAKHVGSGIFSEEEKRYYFFKNVREPGSYFVESVNEVFKDTLKFFPYDEEGYYGNYPSRSSFMKNDGVYVGRPFNDTIMLLKSGLAIPKFIFDFEKYAQQLDELKKKSQDLSPPDLMNFINNKAKLYFLPFSWYITDSQLYSGFKFEKDFYNVFFNRKNQTPHVIEGRLKNDIDESFDPFSFSHHFRDDKTGFYLPGKTLFKDLQKKKAELGQEGFEEYVKGKGKNFAQVAFAAKDSENPVLIVYTVKK
ncbi:6-bladed beta-propeller [Algoriphagus yeomjeoni]|uniref:6-bladed beta-propeller n=1 Tax=Algoriphagus yeomjeoni TaxID=291403 RepID=UPI003CE4EE63